MVMKFNEVEEVKRNEPGNYLFQIKRSEEKTYNSGNTGYELDFETENGFKMLYQKFFGFGKAANHMANLLHALGYCENETAKELETSISIPEAVDLAGLWVNIECVWDEDKKYLIPAFCGFSKANKTSNITEPKKEVAAAPF